MHKTYKWAITLVACLAMVALASVHDSRAEEAGTFTGAWTANGNWQPLEFGPDREVFTFHLRGHVNLKGELGEESDYWAEIAGIWDSQTGATARCSWREVGGRGTAYAILEGRLLDKDVVMVGEFAGGTGDLAGLSGSFTFKWSQVILDEEARAISAFAKNLSGNFQLP